MSVFIDAVNGNIALARFVAVSRRGRTEGVGTGVPAGSAAESDR
ncbi:hypothetical protein [Halotalea alkalilenta]|nr:hypothetical protein [Halotalea alkalilenta]